jgi:hypothetical protein
MRKAWAALACTVLILALFLVPGTAAAPSGAAATIHKGVSGTWSWVTPGGVVWKTTSNGTQYVTGTEDGTWTGTFSGTSKDAFDGKIRPNGSPWGLLRIDLTGTVRGKSGTLEILTTWVVPEEHPTQLMTGRWSIVSGTGGLADLHGQGTWKGVDPNTSAANYKGIITFVP